MWLVWVLFLTGFTNLTVIFIKAKNLFITEEYIETFALLKKRKKMSYFMNIIPSLFYSSFVQIKPKKYNIDYFSIKCHLMSFSDIGRVPFLVICDSSWPYYDLFMIFLWPFNCLVVFLMTFLLPEGTCQYFFLIDLVKNLVLLLFKFSTSQKYKKKGSKILE